MTVIDDENQSVPEPVDGCVVYLNALAAAAPTPGGGSAAAMVAAIAAALGEMVCNLTIGRVADEAKDVEMQRVLKQTMALRHRLMTLRGDDEAAYAGYASAAGLPRKTVDEKTFRRQAMEGALLEAAEVPLATAETCLELLRLLEPITRIGNKHVLSDAEVAAVLGVAGLRSALVNVRVNTAMMRDKVQAERIEGQAARIEAEVGLLTANLSTAAAARRSW